VEPELINQIVAVLVDIPVVGPYIIPVALIGYALTWIATNIKNPGKGSILYKAYKALQVVAGNVGKAKNQQD